jgi:hypothetical protein
MAYRGVIWVSDVETICLENIRWETIRRGYEKDTYMIEVIELLHKNLQAPEHKQMVDEAYDDAYESTIGIMGRPAYTEAQLNLTKAMNEEVDTITSHHKPLPEPSFIWMDSLDAFNWKEIEEGVAHPNLMIQAIRLLRKNLPTPQATPEPSLQHPTDIASQVGRFFVLLQEQAPEIVHSYLLHLSISLRDHPDLLSKVCGLLRQLEHRAKTRGQSAGRLGFRWVQGDENEPSDSDTEGD